MTKEEILSHPADRNLDAWVSEHVFGIDATWRHWFAGATRHYDFMDDNHVIIPKYSTDISAAWEVVEKMHDKEFAMQIMHVVDGNYFVAFSGYIYNECIASTAPAAISKAALLAVMEGKDEES